jgi:hypothetical protein
LRLGRQPAARAGLGTEPLTECLRFVPGDPHDRLLGFVERIPQATELVAMPRLESAIVGGIETGELPIGHFTGSQPERTINLHHCSVPGGRRLLGRPHRQPTWRDACELHAHTRCQVDCA